MRETTLTSSIRKYRIKILDPLFGLVIKMIN